MADISKKGFTLVELLATITIIGIISILAFPSLNRIITNNKEKKFEYYADSIKKGAKLYIESHNKDIWDKDEAGDTKINYSDLKTDYLIKDYNNDNTTCDNNGTYVIVTKNSYNNYTYEIHIKCTKNNKIVYENIIK